MAFQYAQWLDDFMGAKALQGCSEELLDWTDAEAPPAGLVLVPCGVAGGAVNGMNHYTGIDIFTVLDKTRPYDPFFQK